MSVRHQSLGQQVDGHNKEGGGDAANYSSDQSTCSTPSRSRWEYSSEGDSDSSRSSDKKQGSKTSKENKAKKTQQVLKQKTSCAANHRVLKLPPIKPLQGPRKRIQSARMRHIKELDSQVWDLQHQLSGVTTENKLLRQLQHRQTVALQHIQDSESTFPQVLAKHSSEVRVLDQLLRNTRISRNSLARQLRGTEDELLHTKDSLQHLQLLSQDRSLLERQELTQRLAKATADLDRKNKRIRDLERHLELCQASFSRQIVTETKKTNEARTISSYLHEQINQLTQKIKDRERELDMHNIYSHRLPKGWNKKGRETKTVETDELFSLHIEAAGHLELEYSNTEEGLEEKQSFASRESLAIEYPDPEDSAVDKSEDGDLGDIEKCADTDQQNGCSDQSPDPQAEGGSTEEKEAASPPRAAEREQTEACESQVSYTLEKTLHTTQPNSKGFKFPGTRHPYIFKQTIQNMHSGKPAYSSLNKSPHECNMSQMELENLSTRTREPSFMILPAEKRLGCGVAGEERPVQNRRSSQTSPIIFD